jgi:hypothetical protein
MIHCVPFRLDDLVLDEDADEVLLELLARDAEPPPEHHQPHRRWVAPPRYGYGPDGFFVQVERGWWRVTPWEEIDREREEDARQRRAQKAAEAAAEAQHRVWWNIHEAAAARWPERRPVADLPEEIVDDQFLDLLWAAGEYLQVYRYLAQRVSRRGGP